jgi:hypothetical protein
MDRLKQLEKALKEALLSKPTSKAKYENKKPSKFEKNQKWRLDEKTPIQGRIQPISATLPFKK